MKTTTIDIHDFLDQITAQQLQSSMKEAQERLLNEAASSNGEWIKNILSASLNELYASFDKKPPFSLSAQIIQHTIPDLLTIIQADNVLKELLFKLIEETNTSDTIGIYKNIASFYQNRQQKQLAQMKAEYTSSQKLPEDKEKQLETLIKENQKFVYAASHSLQEPLRMVSSYLQIICNRYKDKLDKEGIEFMEYAIDGSIRMGNLLNNLLEYSRLTSMTEIKKTSTAAILTSVIESNYSFIQENNAHINFNYETLPEINTDPNLISKLFYHLISNAIKFKSDKIPIVTIASERLDSEYRFSISDNGIGIPKEYFETIFVLFQRLHAKNKYPGAGVGLAICKKIVELHGGNIWVESEPEKGSTFYFTLPFQPITI